MLPNNAPKNQGVQCRLDKDEKQRTVWDSKAGKWTSFGYGCAFGVLGTVGCGFALSKYNKPVACANPPPPAGSMQPPMGQTATAVHGSCPLVPSARKLRSHEPGPKEHRQLAESVGTPSPVLTSRKFQQTRRADAATQRRINPKKDKQYKQQKKKKKAERRLQA